MSDEVHVKNIDIEVITHRETGLMVAMSDQIPGLFVHGRTFEELEDRLPIAIKDIFEHEARYRKQSSVLPREAN